MTVTEILAYSPQKRKIPTSLDPRLSTIKKAAFSEKIEGEYRLFILVDVKKNYLPLIANQANYHDFRMLALTRLALLTLKSVNWIRTKPRKIAKLTAKKLGIAEPIFSTWYREILLKVLSDSQLEYLSRKAPENQRQDIDHERKVRMNGIK